MEKKLLLAGKDINTATEFIQECEKNARQAVFTSDQETEKSFLWHPSSPISARALIVKAESKMHSIDEAVLYFDEPYYTENFPKFTTQECSKVITEITAGFQYLTLELISRFEKKPSSNFLSTSLSQEQNTETEKKNPKLVFIIKKALNKSLPHIAAAASSFMSFAESIAIMYHEQEKAPINVMLVLADSDNELKTENEIAKWLCNYIDESDQKGKSHQNLNWVRPGAKVSRGIFSFR
ncbi:MAG: hypothetical protein K6F69_04755 [Treponema sp.]|nr:hypothetical protein [Treponema sp.]